MDEAPTAAAVRVIVADDDPLVREVLREAVRAAGSIVVAGASDGREAVELALFYRPDVVLMDVVMPRLDGVAATQRLRELVPATRVLLVAGIDDADLAVSGLRAGASGFVRKSAGTEAIGAAVLRTAAGESVVDPVVVSALIEQARAVPDPAVGLRPVASPLTDREWEILDGLCVGLSTDELAMAFTVSLETVRTHLKSVFRKLGVHSQAEAVAAAPALRRPRPAVSRPLPPPRAADG